MIALIPCVVFLLVGVGGATYLIVDAAKTKTYYTGVQEASASAGPLLVSLQEERRLTLRRLASLGTLQSELAKQRTKTDAAAKSAAVVFASLESTAQQSNNERNALMAQLPAIRARVDGGQIDIGEVFSYYNQIIDQFIVGAQRVADFAPDSKTAFRELLISPLLSSADLMQRADALAAADLTGGGLNAADFRSFQAGVSAYHQQLETTVPVADKAVQVQYAALKQSPAWQRLTSVENTLLQHKTQIPISEDLWRGASAEVGQKLVALSAAQGNGANAAAVDTVNAMLLRAIIAGILVVLLGVGAFLVALRLSHRLISRLSRLRTEALDLADHKLPELVEKVRTGADVSVADSVGLVDHGADEIGEVAEAFNKAQQTAVSAAVQEAKTREGTKTVFLNIAHRSQVIVHRQLKVLDEAEREQEDPAQLEMLFQLDHLSTRARRNAENLIILGGSQPGRRWRNPVSLTELTRGAAAETENFSRVKIAKLPNLAVNGPVVGDLVHLLAELIDNATSFSPPESRVEVRGNVVGRGVVLEIEDQGLGIEGDRIDELNMMLASPPDFGIMALSSEPRLGLFVVARLAARHGIAVSLRESAYGGTRAIVLVRSELLGEVPSPGSRNGQNGWHEPSTQQSAPVTPMSSVKLPIPVVPDLPPFPVVEPRPGEDLFRPQRPVEPADGYTNGANGSNGAHARLDPPTITVQVPPSSTGPLPLPHRPVGQLAPDRPPLPQRRRQQNLAPQLRDDSTPAWREDEPTREETPDEARSRLAAFQRGTMRGREAPDVGESDSDGDDTTGSVRNG